MHPYVHSSTIYRAKCWKQPKCPSVNEWIKKLWYIYSVEFYTTEREEGAPTLHVSMVATVVLLSKEVLLSDISQAVKDKYHMISPISET